MGLSYSIAEARAQLAALVDRAEKGGTVEITRRGRPAAVLLSVGEAERLRGGRRGFAEDYREFLLRHDLAKHGLDGDFTDEVRSREPGRTVRF